MIIGWLTEVISSPSTIAKIFGTLTTVSKLVIGFEDRFASIEKRLDSIELGLAGAGIKQPSVDKPESGVNA